jgi:hypothetical protein
MAPFAPNSTNVSNFCMIKESICGLTRDSVWHIDRSYFPHDRLCRLVESLHFITSIQELAFSTLQGNMILHFAIVVWRVAAFFRHCWMTNKSRNVWWIAFLLSHDMDFNELHISNFGKYALPFRLAAANSSSRTTMSRAASYKC